MKISLQKRHFLIKVVYVLTREANFLNFVCSKISECNMNLSVITRQLIWGECLGCSYLSID